MLLTDLEHAFAQANLTPNLRRALEFLRGANLDNLPVGRVEVDGERVYAMVQVYETRPAGEQVTFEGHRRYIDVQYLVSGQEAMGWAAAGRFEQSYDESKDAWVVKCAPEEGVLLRLRAGELAIFYPEDAHAPGLADGKPEPARKIVIKVAV